MRQQAEQLCREGEALREAGRLEEAASMFRSAVEADPESAEVHDRLGRVLNNLRHLDEAADAFRRAIALRPEHAESHDRLGHVLRARGELADAERAFLRAVELQPLLASAHRNLGITHMLQGAPDAARGCLQRFLEIAPEDVEGWIDLGIVCHTLGRFREAREAYDQALRRAPEHPRATLNLALVHVELRQTEAAERLLRRALELMPGQPEPQAELIALLEETNRVEEASRLAAAALAAHPDDARLILEGAKCERREGRVEQALDRLRQLRPDTLPGRLAQQVYFELGTLYDRTADADAAFASFEQGNRLASRSWRMRNVDPARYLAELDRLREFFARADIGSWAAAPASERRPPTFLIGFPRSGTTLIDLILDSHPRLQTMEERPTLNAVQQALAGMPGGYPAALAGLSPADIDALRDRYFDAVARTFEADPGKQLIDKLPIRTVHTGLIWRLFPEAGIIFVLRHPCDVILSGFMQQYALNDAFANFFTLEDAVRIYDKVMRLWQLYTERLPLRYRTVRYEDLIASPETQARELLDFLGVEWSEAVLGYRERIAERGRINTNSYAQVAEPIYQRARYRWLRYRKHFEPFLPVLAPHLERFGYDAGKRPDGSL